MLAAVTFLQNAKHPTSCLVVLLHFLHHLASVFFFHSSFHVIELFFNVFFQASLKLSKFLLANIKNPHSGK